MTRLRMCCNLSAINTWRSYAWQILLNIMYVSDDTLHDKHPKQVWQQADLTALSRCEFVFVFMISSMSVIYWLPCANAIKHLDQYKTSGVKMFYFWDMFRQEDEIWPSLWVWHMLEFLELDIILIHDDWQCTYFLKNGLKLPRPVEPLEVSSIVCFDNEGHITVIVRVSWNYCSCICVAFVLPKETTPSCIIFEPSTFAHFLYSSIASISQATGRKLFCCCNTLVVGILCSSSYAAVMAERSEKHRKVDLLFAQLLDAWYFTIADPFDPYMHVWVGC